MELECEYGGEVDGRTSSDCRRKRIGTSEMDVGPGPQEEREQETAQSGLDTSSVRIDRGWSQCLPPSSSSACGGGMTVHTAGASRTDPSASYGCLIDLVKPDLCPRYRMRLSPSHVPTLFVNKPA